MGVKDFGIERKQQILERLEVLGRIQVSDLARELDVSKETLRKDLSELEQEKLLKRTHGGAVGLKQSVEPSEIKYIYRVKQCAREKERICRKAASLVQDGDTIFVDNSSTNLALLKYIDPSCKVTVITNSVRVLLEDNFSMSNSHTVISLGGIFRRDFFSCVGDFANEMARKFHPNRAFLSAYGLGEDGTIYDISMYETEVKKFFIQASDQVYLTADHTKINRSGGAILATLDLVDYLICDRGLTDAQTETLQSFDVELIVADGQEGT